MHLIIQWLPIHFFNLWENVILGLSFSNQGKEQSIYSDIGTILII